MAATTQHFDPTAQPFRFTPRPATALDEELRSERDDTGPALEPISWTPFWLGLSGLLAVFALYLSTDPAWLFDQAALEHRNVYRHLLIGAHGYLGAGGLVALIGTASLVCLMVAITRLVDSLG